MNTIKTDPTVQIIQQLLEHNNQLLHTCPLEDILSYDKLKTCFSDFIDYSEYPSVRAHNFEENYEDMPSLLHLLLPYCTEFITHPGTCYQYDKGNFFINITWVKTTIEKVGREYMYATRKLSRKRVFTVPFTGDYSRVRLKGGTYVFNYPHRDYKQDKNMMNILAVFQVFISDCLDGEKLYEWFYYYIGFLLFSLLSVLLSGDVKGTVTWCNPRFSHRYAPIVFYSLQESEISGLAGIVECNKSLLEWWEPTKTFYEDMVKVQCKRVKTV